MSNIFCCKYIDVVLVRNYDTFLACIFYGQIHYFDIKTKNKLLPYPSNADMQGAARGRRGYALLLMI